MSMRHKFQEVKVLDSELASTLGGLHDVKLPGGKYIQSYQLRVNLGTLSGGTSPTWNSGAEFEIFDSIDLDAVNYSTTGPLVHFWNAYRHGVTIDNPTTEEFQYAQRGGIPVGAFSVPAFAQPQLSLDLDDLGDITSGSPTSQSGTEVVVSAATAPNGHFRGVPFRGWRNSKYNAGSTGEMSPQDVRGNGAIRALIVEEAGATIDRFTLDITESDGTERTPVDDMNVSDIRDRMAQESGNSSLPTGWFVMPLQDPIPADAVTANLIPDIGATGDFRVHKLVERTVKEAQQ